MGHAMTHKPTNVIGIAALAAMAGALAALLFAPKSGEEMRRDIKEKAKRAQEMSKDKMEATKDKMKQMKGSAADKIGDVSEEMKNENEAGYGVGRS